MENRFGAMAIDFDWRDYIFPQHCFICGRQGQLVCDHCRLNQKFSLSETSGLNGDKLIWSLADYGDPIIAKAIKHFKYDFITSILDEFWQPALADFWRQKQSYFQEGKWLLAPVPLHRKKELRRGFNQSRLIAGKLSQMCGWPVADDLLLRIKNNRPQAKKSAVAREASVAGIFKVNYWRLSDCWGCKILLVDDVATTGSTLKECANILQSAGFDEIAALVLAS